MTHAQAVRRAEHLLAEVTDFREQLRASELFQASDKLGQAQSQLRWIIKNKEDLQ